MSSFVEAHVTRKLPSSFKRDSRLQKLANQLKQSKATLPVWHNFIANSERLVYSLELLKKEGISGKEVCELGPAGLGLACANELGCKVTGFDCVDDFFKPVYEPYGVPVKHLDLNISANIGKEVYDCIIFCEVIEHLARFPELTLRDLEGPKSKGTYFADVPVPWSSAYTPKFNGTRI